MRELETTLETNWKCPFRVCVLLLTDKRKRSKWLLLSCYMGHELRTAKDNGHLCVTPAVFLPCAWSVLLALVGEATSPQLACALVNAAGSKHLSGLTWFLLRCVCFRSDSTIALKSSWLIAGAEKPLPSSWHIYSSPTFASLEPSSPILWVSFHFPDGVITSFLLSMKLNWSISPFVCLHFWCHI